MKVTAGVDTIVIINVIVIISRKCTNTSIRVETLEAGRVLKQRRSSRHIERAGNVIRIHHIGISCIVVAAVVVGGVKESESRESWLVRRLKARGERRRSWRERRWGGAPAVARRREVVLDGVMVVVASGGGGGRSGCDWERE